jgi:uncharacterized metal-binding protein
MPSGKTHLRIELFVLPLCVALLFAAAAAIQLIAVGWEEYGDLRRGVSLLEPHA